MPSLDNLVGVLISSTSKNSNYTTYLDYCLLKNIDSFIENSSNNNKYNFYIGYDTGDLFFEKNHENILNHLNNLNLTNYFFSIHRVANISTSNPCYVWNFLAKLAYEEDCDYLFQTGDDIIYKTKEWDTSCIN